MQLVLTIAHQYVHQIYVEVVVLVQIVKNKLGLILNKYLNISFVFAGI